MLKMNHDLEGALKAYLRLLDQEEYFEAHEMLEEAWHHLRLSSHPLSNLVKGLINGAITFEHIKRNRKNVPSKDQKVISSYERYKMMSTPQIKYAELFAQACEKIEALKVKHKEVFDVLVP